MNRMFQTIPGTDPYLTKLLADAKRTPTRAEAEKRTRARKLQEAFESDEALAKWMHELYRAANKALGSETVKHYRGSSSKGRHDHGWSGCHNKEYFLRRARWERSLNGEPFNGRIKKS